MLCVRQTHLVDELNAVTPDFTAQIQSPTSLSEGSPLEQRWSVIGSIDEGGALLGQDVYLCASSRFGTLMETHKRYSSSKKVGDVVEAAENF